ncbi:MAG: hypothetical protein Q7R62_03765 [bacterium]|nr:hypothetical protein [bacterium]
MFRMLKASLKDREAMQVTAVSQAILADDGFDYSKVIIKKPWGKEYLIFQNQQVAVWVLHIAQDFQTSLHCHPNKETSLTVLSGVAEITSYSGTYRVSAGEGVWIERGAFHSTRAVSQGGVIVMETENSINKRDLVRFQDKYGRKAKAYEGRAYHDFYPNESINHIFHDEANRYNRLEKVGDCNIMIARHLDIDHLKEHMNKTDAVLINLLSGMISKRNQEVIGKPGDMFVASQLVGQNDIYLPTESEILFICKNNP